MGTATDIKDPTMGILPAKLAAISLIVLIIGLPINHIGSYALLAAATVFICVGSVETPWWRWPAALAIAAITITVQIMTAPPPIEEGHNVFVYDVTKPKDALERQLPSDVFRFMAVQFDALYPTDRRCDPRTDGCWRSNQFPKSIFAFSSDAALDRPAYSRRVNTIDFDDPTWQRLGFTNDLGYNWYNHTSDVQRGYRDPRAWLFWHRWRLTMPWYVMYQFPTEYVGSELCWRGDALWEQADGTFAHYEHATITCRTLQSGDIGRRIFGVSIHPDSLAMKLNPTTGLHLRQLAMPLLVLTGTILILLLLVRYRPCDLRLPLFLLGIGIVLTLLSDAALFGGYRYHDGGDDGLVYEGRGRLIVEYLLQGDLWQALRGEADVFYYTPGMRYLRAVERLIFGETNLGYLSLLLAMPALLWSLFRRFLTTRWALVLIIIFVLTPVGLLFGSNYFLYIQNASRGYADAAAAIIFLGGIVLLLRGSDHTKMEKQFMCAFGAALLMAIAVQTRPNLAPAIAVLLGTSGIIALWHARYKQLSGLCIGFLPVFLCAIHNWIYGRVFVLFSANAVHDSVYKVTPFDYLRALHEMAAFNFKGEHITHIFGLLVGWLSGPRELVAMVPLHACAFAILIRVCCRHNFDPQLRIIAAATVAGHAVAFFYISTPRYYLVIWLLTLFVTAVWLQKDGLPLLLRRFPYILDMIRHHPLSRKADKILVRCERLIGLS